MTELSEFTRDALSHGHSREEVREVLRQAGWRSDEVEQALSHFADLPFPVPVPRPRAYASPREAFLHLVLFTGLYVTAFSTGALGFALVDLLIPDPVQESMGYGPQDPFGPIRWSAAGVIIAFPIYLWLLRKLRREYAADPQRRVSPVRRWLTAITLFIAAVVLIGDGISVVTNLLGGEITVRFLLKALVVGGVAAAVIGCHIWDLQGTDAEAPSGERLRSGQERKRGLIARAAGVAVVAILVAALGLAGSPFAARERAADERRVQALQSISSAVDAFYDTKDRLPDSLEELREQPSVYLESIRDVRTGQPYEYRKLGPKSYELCATFETDTSATRVVRPGFGNLWNHPAGRHCFKLSVRD